MPKRFRVSGSGFNFLSNSFSKGVTVFSGILFFGCIPLFIFDYEALGITSVSAAIVIEIVDIIIENIAYSKYEEEEKDYELKQYAEDLAKYTPSFVSGHRVRIISSIIDDDSGEKIPKDSAGTVVGVSGNIAIVKFDCLPDKQIRLAKELVKLAKE